MINFLSFLFLKLNTINVYVKILLFSSNSYEKYYYHQFIQQTLNKTYLMNLINQIHILQKVLDSKIHTVLNSSPNKCSYTDRKLWFHFLYIL